MRRVRDAVGVAPTTGRGDELGFPNMLFLGEQGSLLPRNIRFDPDRAAHLWIRGDGAGVSTGPDGVLISRIKA